MRRFWFLVVLMALNSSAHAGNSLSFVVGGHRIRIEAPRHCNSPSCVSVSIPGIYGSRRWRDRLDDDDARDLAVPPVSAPAPVSVQPVPPASHAPAAPAVAAVPPPAVFKPAAAATQEVAAPPAPAPPSPPQAVTPPVVAPPVETMRPKPQPVPQVVKASLEVEDEPADTPLGDWRSEGHKGSVRIERCGRALCGYAIDAASSNKGEAVLVNMKPNTERHWTGSVYSHDSGDTYYGTMALQGPNALRVEACALGRFYCSGNHWTRIGARPERLISSRQLSAAPRS